MATYALGDLQGCAREFEHLLNTVRFGASDRLWLLGDLINRGPESLATLERVRELEDRCTIVLGNHDLHFLAIYFGGHSPSRSDTFDELLASADADDHAHWLRRQPLFHRERIHGVAPPDKQADGAAAKQSAAAKRTEELDYVMTHAGIPHVWSLQQAEQLSNEVESAISGRDPRTTYQHFFRHMYGNEPARWDDDLAGMPRLRAITNYLTRMRLIHADGTLDFSHKGALADAPPGWHPWFELTAPRLERERLLFGHWAALDGHTGQPWTISLDTGCVWGRQLTALCLETGELHSVPAAGA